VTRARTRHQLRASCIDPCSRERAGPTWIHARRSRRDRRRGGRENRLIEIVAVVGDVLATAPRQTRRASDTPRYEEVASRSSCFFQWAAGSG
jgi:hypothetical protein